MHQDDMCASARVRASVAYVCRMGFSAYERKVPCVCVCVGEQRTQTQSSWQDYITRAVTRTKSEARELIIGLENKIGGNLVFLVYTSPDPLDTKASSVCACAVCGLPHATTVYAPDAFDKRYLFFGICFGLVAAHMISVRCLGPGWADMIGWRRRILCTYTFRSR